MSQTIELIKSLTNKNVQAILSTKTVVKMNKKDVATKTEANPYGEIIKTTTDIVYLNPEYQNAVREATGDQTFEAGERTWGENIGNGIVQKGDDLYVSYILKEQLHHTAYVHNGEFIEKSEFERFLPVKKITEGSTTDVGFRNVKLSNILDLKLVPTEFLK